MKMLDLEGQWTDLLATNSITSIVHSLSIIIKNGSADVDKSLTSFFCWLQRTAEFTKKELLSLCLSRCQGLWMFLNRYSSRRVHNLLQKLRNLITLVQWARRNLQAGQSWAGIDCTSNTKRVCWSREDKDLRKHLWLGRLVEWWNLMGLLPKHPEPKGEKQISHMWKEMNQSQQKTGLNSTDEQRSFSVIQGLMTHLVKQHGSLWTTESSGNQWYPPPSLKALLKLVLVPHVDTLSVQAVIMYFILDVAKFLQCKNDLFESFCHAFTIPAGFPHQIKALWMLDHGQIKTAMNLLLSPRTALSRFSWHHRCILKSLLSRKEPLLALRYLHLNNKAVESVEDVKLHTEVLLQNSCVSEAWALIKRYNSDDMVNHFLHTCEALGLRAEASKFISPNYKVHCESDARVALQLKVGCPCPLSAVLYQAQKDRLLTMEELMQLLTQAIAELRLPPTAAPMELTWPQLMQKETKTESSEIFLNTEVLFLRSPSPSIVEITARSDDCYPETSDHLSSCPSPAPPVYSKRRVSFSSVSSLSPIRKDQTFSYESTVTLQQISALLNHGQEEEEEVSQISITAEVFPESHDRTLDASAVPVIDHPYAPHSSRNRFYSMDCCTDLPSLPEEMVQTPTTPTKPAETEDSEIFQETGANVSTSLPQDTPQKGVCDADWSCEIPVNSLNTDVQTNQSDQPVQRGNAPAGQSHLPPHSHLPYMTFTQHSEESRSGAQGSSTGKIPLRSRRIRKNKTLK